MIVDERLVTYINSLDTGNTEILDEIEREALDSYVPIVRKEMQSFLKLILSIKRPARILEVGTAVGFSAILMAEYNPVPCEITTIENYEKRIPIAKENFRRAGKEKQITLLEGDAADILKELQEPFDFIFMDAAKGQYIHFMPEILRLLKPEGILVSDNVLQDGDIIESHFIVTRRNRTIYKRMREYLYELTHSEELVTSVLPIGDGITVSVKKEKYTPYQTDNFKVEIEIRSGNKVIAGGSYISEAASSADSEYQEAYINLDYQGNMEKATDIYVNILSTTKTSFGSDDLQKAGTIDLTDCATGWTTHLGSRLKIDDLELIYE